MHLAREEKHGLSANSAAEHSAFLRGEQRKTRKRLWWKAAWRMWGVLEEALRLPVSGSLLGGTAWLLLPVGRLSRCLRDSAAFTNNTRGWERAGVRPEPKKKKQVDWAAASDVRFSIVFFYCRITQSYCNFNWSQYKQQTNKAGRVPTAQWVNESVFSLNVSDTNVSCWPDAS